MFFLWVDENKFLDTTKNTSTKKNMNSLKAIVEWKDWDAEWKKNSWNNIPQEQTFNTFWGFFSRNIYGKGKLSKTSQILA